MGFNIDFAPLGRGLSAIGGAIHQRGLDKYVGLNEKAVAIFQKLAETQEGSPEYMQAEAELSALEAQLVKDPEALGQFKQMETMARMKATAGKIKEQEPGSWQSSLSRGRGHGGSGYGGGSDYSYQKGSDIMDLRGYYQGPTYFQNNQPIKFGGAFEANDAQEYATYLERIANDETAFKTMALGRGQAWMGDQNILAALGPDKSARLQQAIQTGDVQTILDLQGEAEGVSKMATEAQFKSKSPAYQELDKQTRAKDLGEWKYKKQWEWANAPKSPGDSRAAVNQFYKDVGNMGHRNTELQKQLAEKYKTYTDRIKTHQATLLQSAGEGLPPGLVDPEKINEYKSGKVAEKIAPLLEGAHPLSREVPLDIVYQLTELNGGQDVRTIESVSELNKLVRDFTVDHVLDLNRAYDLNLDVDEYYNYVMKGVLRPLQDSNIPMDAIQMHRGMVNDIQSTRIEYLESKQAIEDHLLGMARYAAVNQADARMGEALNIQLSPGQAKYILENIKLYSQAVEDSNKLREHATTLKEGSPEYMATQEKLLLKEQEVREFKTNALTRAGLTEQYSSLDTAPVTIGEIEQPPLAQGKPTVMGDKAPIMVESLTDVYSLETLRALQQADMSDRRVRKVIELLEQRTGDTVSMEDLSRALQYAITAKQGGLSSITQTGQSPTEWIKQRQQDTPAEKFIGEK